MDVVRLDFPGKTQRMSVCRYMYPLLLTLVVMSQPICAQTIPAVTGRTFTLPTSPYHKLFIPDTLNLTGDNVDVLVHFHGDPATVENNAGYAGLNAVIVNVTYPGLSSAYSTPFSDPALFGDLLDSALTTLRDQPDIPDTVHWDQLSVSSFSAGYGAVRKILQQPTYFDRIDGLLLADSLYASFTSSTDHTPLASQMVDFEAYAIAATNGTKTMIVSHSQVPTYTYANTVETADDLMQYVGVTPYSVNEAGLGTLQFYRRAEIGNFQVWGATGSDAAAHSKHLQYIGQWLGDLPFDSDPSGPVDPIVTLDDFEVDEGTFDYPPLYSGSNIGIQAAAADRVTTEAHTGIGSQRIDVTKDPASPTWRLRHTSGGGFPSHNVPINAEGYIGFWLKTDSPGVSVCLGLDDPDSADLSTLTPVSADGQWHLYQWDLDDPGQWHAWVDGDGTITGPTFTIDGIFFTGNTDATLYLDDVAYNNAGSILPGDFNGDGYVGLDDLQIILDHWNQTVPNGSLSSGDPNGDGYVGLDDLQIILDHWNIGAVPVPQTIPEPAAGIGLAVLGLGGLMKRGGAALG